MKNKIQSFFWGILAAGAALFLELIVAFFLKIDHLDASITVFIIMIAFSVVIEEIIKYTVILKSIDILSFGKGAITNAWIAGIGFSLVEISFLYQKILTENLIFDKMDMFKASLLHILTFGVFGYQIAIKKDRKLDIVMITIVAIMHFTYNISTQYKDETTYSTGTLVLLILLLYNIFGVIVVNKKLAHE